MKLIILAAAIGLSLALFAARANGILAVTETGEDFNDLVVTFNGSPLDVTLTGEADHWIVELPVPFGFSQSRLIIIGEPEITFPFNHYNEIRIGGRLLTWDSDIGTIIRRTSPKANKGGWTWSFGTAI